MADGTINGITRDGKASPHRPQGLPATVEIEPNRVQQVAARLYGQGYKRAEVARILMDHLVSEAMSVRPTEQKMHAARNKLKRWEQSQKFRDLLYQSAVVQLDLQSGVVMQGIAKKAKRGRVDAARLMFELTGRHNPKGDSTPTQVAIVLNGVPRPVRNHAAVDVDMQAVLAEENED